MPETHSHTHNSVHLRLYMANKSQENSIKKLSASSSDFLPIFFL